MAVPRVYLGPNTVQKVNAFVGRDLSPLEQRVATLAVPVILGTLSAAAIGASLVLAPLATKIWVGMIFFGTMGATFGTGGIYWWKQGRQDYGAELLKAEGGKLTENKFKAFKAFGEWVDTLDLSLIQEDKPKLNQVFSSCSKVRNVRFGVLPAQELQTLAKTAIELKELHLHSDDLEEFKDFKTVEKLHITCSDSQKLLVKPIPDSVNELTIVATGASCDHADHLRRDFHVSIKGNTLTLKRKVIKEKRKDPAAPEPNGVQKLMAFLAHDLTKKEGRNLAFILPMMVVALSLSGGVAGAMLASYALMELVATLTMVTVISSFAAPVGYAYYFSGRQDYDQTLQTHPKAFPLHGQWCRSLDMTRITDSQTLAAAKKVEQLTLMGTTPLPDDFASSPLRQRCLRHMRIAEPTKDLMGRLPNWLKEVTLFLKKGDDNTVLFDSVHAKRLTIHHATKALLPKLAHLKSVRHLTLHADNPHELLDTDGLNHLAGFDGEKLKSITITFPQTTDWKLNERRTILTRKFRLDMENPPGQNQVLRLKPMRAPIIAGIR
ncbi:MAG: hypothetical protein KDK65_02070 [Chlamydiia bacterium]|nr:hypothetical protein [Chlamydiia bacterium]